MKTRKLLALALALVMVFSLCGSAFAFYTDEELEAFGLDGYTPNEIENNEVSKELALESYVLLRNNGALPIAKDGKIALFGNGATGTVRGGIGSGIVNVRERDWIDTAFEDAGYEITTPQAYRDAVTRGVVATGFLGDREAVDVPITDEWMAEATASDTAIYVLARVAGEGNDRRDVGGNGAWKLTDAEYNNIKKITQSFDKVIIVLNTYVTDISWLKDFNNIDAVLHIGYGGQRTGETALQVLNGTVSPSGKTNATWAWSLDDYLSTQAGFSWMDGNTNTEYYTDGIYVGYRYFDTFGLVDEVAFPFGFGLSYTDFDIAVDDVTVDAENVTVTATVTNIGDTYSGKEVVEVYFSAPDSEELEKPYQELAAFAKTDTLAPGEAQTLTIKFATSDMSSYSEAEQAYVMDPGDYIIRVGNSSRNTHVAAVATLDDRTVTETLSNQFPLEEGAELDEVSKAGVSPITYDGEADEIANAERIAIPEIETKNNASPYQDETAITYLFADDAENYTPAEKLQIKTKNVAGIIENNIGSGGYKTTTYKEEVSVVDDLPDGITKETAKLTDVASGKISLRQFVACLSADEMVRLAQGAGQGSNDMGYIYDEDGNLLSYTHAMFSNIGRTSAAMYATRHIPALGYADGPAGVRCDQESNNMSCPRIDGPGDQGGSHYWSADGGKTECSPDAEGALEYHMYPTAFPGGTNMSCTWNTESMYKMGVAVGKECNEYNVAAWLAPGMNICRNPMCGRNFEYYSEDPYLTGITGAYTTAGVQSNNGVGVTIKHYFANNQEDNRNAENNVISERAIREIYLTGYEICVKLAQPMYLMTSYNENNGWPSGDNFSSCTDVLRGEWGFNGLVMTDWNGGQSSPHVSVHAGNDMITPGNALSNITDHLGVHAPTFEETGYPTVIAIENHWGPYTWYTYIDTWGTFYATADGEPLYTVPTNAKSEDELVDGIKTAIANGSAIYNAEEGTVTWIGFHDIICLGDIQKSAYNILNVMLHTQDFGILCDDLGIERAPEYENFSAHFDAPLAGEYKDVNVDKAAPAAADVLRVSDDEVALGTIAAGVEVTYNGDIDLSSVRVQIETELPIFEGYDNIQNIEFNPDNNKLVVYEVNGEALGENLFFINFVVDECAPGTYPVKVNVIEATGADAELVDLVGGIGYVTIKGSEVPGDVNQDGIVDNRDLIMIARYLVDLEDFDFDQKKLADYDEDGEIDNTDLVLIARALVEKAEA